MRIGIVASYAPSIVPFRGKLISAILDKGHEVVCFGPIADSKTRKSIERLGVSYLEIPISRAGISILGDLRLLWYLFTSLRKARVELLLSYTIKPVIYGAIAGKLAGINGIYSIITGLGVVYTSSGWKSSLVRRITDFLYRVSLPFNKVVLFQNPDDRRLFQERGLLKNVPRSSVVNGSGVDLVQFPRNPVIVEPLRFTLIARLIATKGVREYTEAVRRLSRLYPKSSFVLVGLQEAGHYDAVSVEEIAHWQEMPNAEFVEWGVDVREVLNRTSVYVLPSYREGLPRTVLEAMAVGRAIITTDAPGCRETVIHGLNGFLVPIGQVEPLVAAMKRFLDEPDTAVTMGEASHSLVKERFDVNKVNLEILESMDLV